jgi:probable addiction module antidote protein
MTTETKPFDAASYLTDHEAQEELISDALASGDARYIRLALGTVARARGMTGVADKAGVTREALYRALSENGDPRLSTVMGVMKALDIQLAATSMDHSPSSN